ncbi:ABC transporter substrate-binding protein [Kocuria sp. p3-SID1433]|uniref:peptide ABC transporter substrate-binding protein n=1 Tax=unclassified Kocuria TaxID=2649579 RepID=UPI0021A7B595|nr:MULTISPECIES: ABC transporter substrate-binding protein [unclassified Kocuria]MCT1601596.1 ABC transporter substrate-binding protein [Kocuria sp. p3-SID1428]MCT2179499.1 ABC transporter substrate-binding protein [Kocuria sp. p3-SID1433]
MSPSISRRGLLGAFALTSASAFVLTACGGEGGGSSDGAINAFSTEPENPLVPTNTTEQGGGRVVSLIFMGLISYNDDSEAVNELAESIEANDDNTKWTIKIKSGKKFTNGEDITAQSFVDSWNYGAAAKNAQQGAYFFETIKGYDKVSAEGSEEDEMEGLVAVDDTTLEVTLSGADSTFGNRLGYASYAPMPASAFEDMDAFGENPVGWGPYKMDGEGAWAHDQEIRLVKNEDYDGSMPPANDAVTFKLYQSLEAGYTDLVAGNLDILDSIPPTNLDVADGDLDGRMVTREYAGNYTFGIPFYLDGWSGEAGKLRRQAISRAINREELIEVVFRGEHKPAKDFTSPVVAGYDESKLQNVENVEFDEAKAKELWAAAEELEPYSGDTFEIAYNADGGHKEWVDAVCNMIKNTLDIEAQGKSYPTFKELRTEANAGELTSAFRSGWMADYPSLYNFLSAQYATDGSSNDAHYENQAFDDKLKEGLAASSDEEANAAFLEADSMLLEDLPAIPLYYPARTAGHSEAVQDVALTWNGEVDYPKISQA